MSSVPPRRRRYSPRVYRRRRAAVLLLLLIVVAAIWISVANALNSAPKPVVTAGSNSTSTPNPAGSGIPSTGASTAAAPCDPKKITVTPIVDSNSFEAGEYPSFQIGVTNSGKEACTFNVGTSQMVMTVTSGDETYWKSSDCQTESSDTEALLLPGKLEVSAPFSWSREYSSPETCGGERQEVPAGGASYFLNVAVGAAKSATGYQFLLY